ncbi:MAG: alpha/beta hydrolase [bacterium]
MPFVRCNDINLYYEIHGQGTPLLFLNGLSSDIAQRTPFIDAAKKGLKIIIPDIRGAGLTDKPHNAYSIAQFTRDAYELVGNLSFKKINVMGFSMGGLVAINFTVDHPELVDKLILVSTKPSWSKPFGCSDEAMRIFHSTDISDALLKDLFHLIYGSRYRKLVSAEEYVRKRMADPNPQPIHGYLNQLNACEKFDMLEKVKTIRKPTLIIAGKEDHFISPENSYWMHDHIADSKLIEYDGVGHLPVDECPERLAKDVINFLS